MAWTEPPRTWVDGETETAAIFNTHVRDQLIYLKAQVDAAQSGLHPFLTMGA